MHLSSNFIVTGDSSVIETSFLYPIHVNEGYELALSGFSCGGICNVDSESDILRIEHVNDSRFNPTVGEVPIPHSHYHNVGELMTSFRKSINTFLKSHPDWGSNRASLKYTVKSNMWTLSMPAHTQIVACSHHPNSVLRLLNIEDGDYAELSAIEAPFDEECVQGFIYCSVVQESFIDNHQSRLLAVVPISRSAKYTFYEPVVLKYRKIAVSQFSSIDIEIRDSSGRLIEFCDYTEHSTCEEHNLTGISLTGLPIVISLALTMPI